MIDRDKYTVFKTEDLKHWQDSVLRSLRGESVEASGEPIALKDCVVIRKSDVFAASALYAYASSIQTTIDILNASGSQETDLIRRLSDLADFFAGEADSSIHRSNRKIPD